MSSPTNTKTLSSSTFMLMIFTTVFNFSTAFKSFLNMGYAAIPWYIVATLGYGIPFAFIVAEMASAFKESRGGFYSWLAPVLGERVAFVAIVMWYAGFLTFVINMASSALWINLSTLIFGGDLTPTISLFGLAYNQSMGLLAIVWIFLATLIASQGLKAVTFFTRIGGIAIWILNILLLLGALLLLIVQRGNIAYQLTEPHSLATLLTRSPNQAFHSPFATIGFLVYAIFAFGGMETSAGLVDKMQNPEQRLPKGLIISTVAIALSYIIGILAIGVFINWEELSATANLNLGNVTSYIIRHLGYTLAITFGGSEEIALVVAGWFGRVVGLGLFFSMLGAFFILIYAPIKQVIEGTPDDLWPKILAKTKGSIPARALYIQAALACLIIIFNSFFGQVATQFVRLLTEATNTAVTLPYAFIAIGYWFFIRNNTIQRPVRLFRSTLVASIASLSVSILVLAANLFGILSTILYYDGQQIYWHITQESLLTLFTYISVPLFFAVLALILWSLRINKNK